MSVAGDYLFLFADLIDSTEVATEASPEFFARTYISSFHWSAHKAMEFIRDESPFLDSAFTKTIKDIKVAGDEVLSFTRIDVDDENNVSADEQVEDLVASAVTFACVLKLYWLASPYNLRRMLSRQFPRDIAVGIHMGPAAVVPSSPTKDVASLHINVTKRIATMARQGTHSRIFASYDVVDLFEKWHERFSQSQLTKKQKAPLLFTRFLDRDEDSEVKGVPRKLKLKELAQISEKDPDFHYLMDHLWKSPQTESVEVEQASRRLVDVLLRVRDSVPFRDEAGNVLVDLNLEGVTTGEEYIDCWFEAIENIPKLFFDEPWIVFNSFLVSCAMMRHGAITNEKRIRYSQVGRKVYDRLRALARNKKGI